jgi:hypothetical protein
MKSAPPSALRSTGLLCLLVCGFCLLAFARPSRSDSAPIQDPATGHWYQVVSVPEGITWADARQAAAARTYQGMQGYLVTITRAEENFFLLRNLPQAVSLACWIGAYQPTGSPEPGGNWQWVTGEKWQYTMWRAGQPDNFISSSGPPSGENALMLTDNGGWNDYPGVWNQFGYVVEYGAPLPPIPLSFRDPVTYPVPQPRQVTTADLDGDGFPDIIAESNGAAAVLYGHGDGTFEAAARYTMSDPGSAEWAWVIAEDVDGDGRKDLVAAAGNSNRIVVRLNQGQRAFGPAASYPVGVQPRAVVAGDFNHDGLLDLAVSNYGSASVGILLNRGFGAFNPMVAYPALGKPGVLVAADFNGDGNLDLALTQYDADSVRTYFGDGNGGFAVGADYAASAYPSSVITGDFDGNGTVDLLVSCGAIGSVCVFSGNGRGAFIRSPFYEAGNWPHLASTADLDGDGDLDVAVPDYGSSRLDLLLNDGGDLTNSFVVDPLGLNTRGSAIADFNRDGRPDVVVTNTDSGSVSVFLNDTVWPAPAAPTTLTVAGRTTTTLNLTWKDQSANESSFDIERKTGSTWAHLMTVPANSTGYQDSGLSPGASYVYRVRSTNAGGPSDWSNEATGITLPLPSTKPTLSAGAVSQTEIGLTWQDPGQKAAGFEIQRREGAGAWLLMAAVGASPQTWADTRLMANTAYTYRIRGTNDGGASDWSDELTVTTLHSAPAAPGGLTATAISSTRIDLAWQNPGETDTFEISRRLGDGAWESLATVGATPTQFQNTGLAPGTRYGYRVRAVNNGGPSPWSALAEATTPTDAAPIPAVPSDVKLTVLSASRIRLAWVDPNHDAISFQIERRTAGGAWAPLPLTSANTLTDSNLAPKTTYTYHVRGSNASGASAWSAEVSATTLGAGPTSPGTLTAIVVQFAKIRLKWQDKSKDETAFFVERKEGTGELATLKQLKPNATTCDDLAVSPGVTYTYRIRAEKSGSEPSFSNEAQAKIALGGKLSITPRSVAFAITKPGKKRVQVVQLKNSGHEVLVGSVGTLDAPFRIVTGSGAFTLIPGALKNVTVEFAPTVVGRATSSLPITSSQVGQPTATVRVSGEGK